METITACENICRDFSFFPRVWNAFLESIPAIAFGWAIVAFYQQRRADREDQQRSNRLSIYSEFIAMNEHALFDPELRKGELEYLSPFYAKLSQIELIAGGEVSTLASATSIALFDLINLDDEPFISRDGQTRRLRENFIWEQRQLIAAMREELNK